LVKYGLVNKDETNTMLEQKNMTNRPNLTEEEKEHYNKVAMDKIYENKIVDALETIANAAGHGDFYAIIDALEYGNAIDPELNEKWYKLYTERNNMEQEISKDNSIKRNNREDLDEDILELCKGTDDAIRELIIKYIDSKENNHNE
jgi:hypothetical protein